MSTEGKIKTLFSNPEKTEALFPRTKTSAISNESGRGLDAILEDLSNSAGMPGATGVQGLTGATGAQGLTGATGSQGPQGYIGATGPSGKDGTGITVKSSASECTQVGDAYIDVNGNIMIRKADGTFTNGGQVKGPQGATGAQGIQGATGPQGNTGSQGATGPQGPAGSNGSNGSNGAIGATGIQGPQGYIGATGAGGAQGPQGLRGATGYTGATGSQGIQGPQGLQGATGPQGPGGSQGPRGYTGATGAAGTNGSNGSQGPRGYTGATGPAGSSLGQNYISSQGTVCNTNYVYSVNHGTGQPMRYYWRIWNNGFSDGRKLAEVWGTTDNYILTSCNNAWEELSETSVIAFNTLPVSFTQLLCINVSFQSKGSVMWSEGITREDSTGYFATYFCRVNPVGDYGKYQVYAVGTI